MSGEEMVWPEACVAMVFIICVTVVICTAIFGFLERRNAEDEQERREREHQWEAADREWHRKNPPPSAIQQLFGTSTAESYRGPDFLTEEDEDDIP
jgi:hypothetical protein